MSDFPKISRAEWWRYECLAAAQAWSEIKTENYIRSGAIAMTTASLTFLGLSLVGIGAEPENKARYVIAVCAFVVSFILVFGLEFLFKLFRAPAKMAKEANAENKRLQDQNEAQEKLHAKEKTGLEQTIESLRVPSAKSPLEIEAIPCDIMAGKRHWCQIRVGSTTTADNVQVELISLDDDLENKEQKAYYRPVFPVILKPEIAGSNSINPGGKLTYNLFQVNMAEGVRREENHQIVFTDSGIMATIEGEAPKENKAELIPYKSFVVYFTQEVSQNVTLLFWKKPYRLKLKVTARHLIEIEREFTLTFSDEGKFCRFNLTKINAVPQREKIAAELSNLLNELNARRHSIEFMPRAAYETDYSNNGGDIKSQELLQKIFNFVLKHFGETEYRLFKSDAGFPLIRLSSNHPNRENTLICLREYGKKIEEMIKNQKAANTLKTNEEINE